MKTSLCQCTHSYIYFEIFFSNISTVSCNTLIWISHIKNSLLKFLERKNYIFIFNKLLFELYLELRTMAHFGLIGFPNAGKSTLLRAISRARPRVAPYPFTTLKPHIGMVPYHDYVQLAVADIPGIIKDAHKNRVGLNPIELLSRSFSKISASCKTTHFCFFYFQGLGISFLRHVERCLCLLYVIDISDPDAFQQFLVLR